MSEDNKSEDWEMSLPHQKLDDDAREIVEKQAEPPEDFPPTEPNIDLRPIAGSSDEWKFDTRTTNEVKSSEWKMPEPVFRVSPGETPQFDRHDFEDDFGSQPAQPPPSAAAADPAPAIAPPPAKKGGSGKFILILVGVFGILAIAAVLLVGAYLLWFTQSSEVRSPVANKPDTNTKPAETAPSPTSKSSSLPSTIDIRGAMVLVPAGEFTMGSDSGPDESRPAHKVTLEAFYIDKLEVTNAQYKEFCDATGHPPPPTQAWDENYFSARPSAPVVGVTFNDAKAYAEWAGKRLPTEAEWEKAASWNPSTRTKSVYPWGNDFDKSLVAFGIAEPASVGERLSGASPSGALDMSGNALEWVDSYFEAYPGTSASNPDFGKSNRVVRGGFIASKTDDYLTTFKRVFLPPDFTPSADRDSFIGFRCAISAADPRVKSASRPE